MTSGIAVTCLISAAACKGMVIVRISVFHCKIGITFASFSTSVGCYSVPDCVTTTYILRGSKPIIDLNVLGCYGIPLTFITRLLVHVAGGQTSLLVVLTSS